METADKWIVLTNKDSSNSLENYAVKPEYSFLEKEIIYRLAKMIEGLFFYLNDRFPDKALDVFVLTAYRRKHCNDVDE